MAQNDPNHPEKARIAQDVEEAPKARGSGDFHAGRGVCLCSTIEGRGAAATAEWRIGMLRKDGEVSRCGWDGALGFIWLEELWTFSRTRSTQCLVKIHSHSSHTWENPTMHERHHPSVLRNSCTSVLLLLLRTPMANIFA